MNKKSKRSKYNVKKVKPVYNGITFDSKLELNHYKYFESNPNIEVVSLQPFFMLLEPFNYYDLEKGKERKYGKFSYKADFLLKVVGIDKLVVFESKGMVKPEFAIRKKMWYKLHGNDYYYIMSKSLKHCVKLFEELEVRVNE